MAPKLKTGVRLFNKSVRVRRVVGCTEIWSQFDS